ncbi:MAG: putative Type IV pilus assembly protein PilB [Candidatus Nitrospira kreftii]|uniref:Putative Type IV pilus assembly protein PilB n=1 Tax=Candidatus Nitrospira kreftii TaxID=2652173 RepID=A0A7S8FHW5_9BACT|nr:MAG: putative Type IV pilus assembly protein PilB [Candidatus Nitrospira kreftii]
MMTQTLVPRPKRAVLSGASLKKQQMGKQPRKMTMERSLLDCIAYRGLISQVDLDTAVEESLSREIDLEMILLEKYRVPRAALGLALSEFYQCPYVSYDERTVIDPDLLKNLSFDYLRRNSWIPLKRQGTVLDIVINDPHDLEKGLDIRRAFPGTTVRFSVGLRRDIEQYLLVATGQANGGSITDILGELVDEAGIERSAEREPGEIDENDSAIVRLTNQIIAEGYRLGVSDIHIEPYSDRKETAVRFRVDGTCFTYMRIPAVYRRAIASRLKIMANLDIAERRKPQDGKIRYKLAKDREIELRVATLPTAGNNEDVVLRLLTPKEIMPLEAMDFAPEILQTVKELSERPHGIFLCVGPTGSGKTTTLHAVMKHINTDERKIWTAEDPIEITQEGLRQVQVHPKIGFTFASAMRAFLRADPDVIMIGEMRDKETADIAIEASLTGHLVMSTLHTNSAVETITRLLDMGCDSFNFADAMLGILAMRLCKRICLHCRESYHPTQQEYDELVQGYGARYWERLGVTYTEDFTLYRGKGCDACNNSGFKGRVALHELLVGSEDLKNLIQGKARTAEILGVAMRDGMVTLLQNGIEKVLRGTTTYRQVRAVAIK